MSDPAIRVLLADDQPLVRAGLRMFLSAQPDIEVVGEAADGREAVEAVAHHRPDVVLMDVRMPNLDGVKATRLITAAQDAPRVLVLTTFDLDEIVYEALRAGASGFLLKDGRSGGTAHHRYPGSRRGRVDVRAIGHPTPHRGVRAAPATARPQAGTT